MSAPPEATGLPATITPGCHRAFVHCLDAIGTIKDTRALDMWTEKASKRWAIEMWTQKLFSKGMRNVPQVRKPLVEAVLRLFLQKHPEFCVASPASR